MDMSHVIVPKSDQINADDLLAGPVTIKIKSVQVKSGQEQPVSIYFDGSDKAYRPCKSMARVMVSAWGADSAKYVGRSLTLYCDPKVRWAGMEVGGIRISHMSHIDGSMTLALTVTRANRKPFTVRQLSTAPAQVIKSDGSSPVAITPAAGATTTADTHGSTARVGPATSQEDVGQGANAESATQFVTPDQALELEALCVNNGINNSAFYKKAGVERFSLVLAKDYQRAHDWIHAVIDKRKQES